MLISGKSYGSVRRLNLTSIHRGIYSQEVSGKGKHILRFGAFSLISRERHLYKTQSSAVKEKDERGGKRLSFTMNSPFWPCSLTKN